jgi:UDP-N-acetylmuramoyl-L-alanine---L-glutamate ligase
MRPPISWSALADASVGIWGLGVEGRASLRRVSALGGEPVLVDDAPSAGELEGLEVLATDQGGLERLLDCDVVVKSPGISRYRAEVAQLEEGGVRVCGGLGLWMSEADLTRVACVTGTKGKSTTTALAVHLLSSLGYHARAGGNIGHPPWDPSAERASDYWVVETSSFQVPDLEVGPRLVAVTSLFPDHLDWHGSVERYYADKLSLCTKPGVEIALANGADGELRRSAPALGPGMRWVGESDVARAASLARAAGLRGRHNDGNAAMARAVLEGLGAEGASDDARLTAAAEGFPGLPSRCHSIGFVDGVEFVDDSLSTNVLPTRAALEAFADRPVALLVGGHDRGIDYAPLGRALAERKEPTLVVTMPDNGPRIGAAVRAASVRGDTALQVLDAQDLAHAVSTAFAWTPVRAVVLLSPAAPSFGRFADYRDRATAFAAAAATCGVLDGGPQA